MSEIIQQISQDLQVKPSQVEAALQLLEEGNTIPFIARYRKEVTGSLDELQINDIQQAHHRATQLLERKEEVQRLISDQDKWSEELEQALSQATSLQQVEDIYRPYKQKRRTKAQIAREQGLEPLAESLLEADLVDLEVLARSYLSDELEDTEAVLAGAHEILAERVGDNAQYRAFIRKYTQYNGLVTTKLKAEDKDPDGVYSIYYDFSEAVNKILDHRILALNRAEKEEVITVKVEVDSDPALNYMKQRFIEVDLPVDKLSLVEAAIEDGYKRFIAPAIEREIRNELTERAETSAIEVFGDNLRHLLLQPPLKGKVVMGFDPAYRTGCKLAVIDETGKLLSVQVVYPHKPANAAQRLAAPGQLKEMIDAYQVEVIAIGNGTASRESEQFVSQVIQDYALDTQFIVINEAGASVYSASKEAREEFPDLQVEERSAVSIARRLQDPLAELIKIDPKSLGVGQYQHDVSQSALTDELDFVVNVAVNQVGVDINTASASLLQHVSGLTKQTANNVIARRNELGRFDNRDQIKEVKRLGPKTFEQAAGFLRVIDGDNPLDQTSIHPESYSVALKVLDKVEAGPEDLGSAELVDSLDSLQLDTLSKELEVGRETLFDIIHGLKHPTADIRDGQAAPILRDDVLSMEDLSIGMQLQGVVRNVVDFGAFVDIGVKEDGLIHISKLSKQFIKHPSQVVAVGDIVEVEVINLDLEKSRIGLKKV